MATPTRRSTRFQRIVIRSSLEKKINPDVKFAWASSSGPLFTRPLDPKWDLLDEDHEKLHDEEDDKREKETRFYDKLRVTRKGKGKGSRPQVTTYAVGDTVLVSLDNRLPSIAVIVAMWETDLNSEDDEEGGGGEEKIRLRVHWFDRPSDLPSIRAKRFYHHVRLIFLS